MWEPFIESSCFQLNILRKCVFHALDVSPSTVVSLNSSKQLNVNISEPFIECVIIRDKGIDDDTDSVLGLGFLPVESSSMFKIACFSSDYNHIGIHV
uniref:Uncharacterized protein n=1 Tax=Aegilops tauschii subsp. strangulata TaxID=200361 RepID=A0A453IDV2_AEGTS